MSWKKRGVALALTLVLTVSTSVVMGAPAQQQVNQQPVPDQVAGRSGRATLTLVGNCLKIGAKDTGSLGVGGGTRPGIQYDDTCTARSMMRTTS